MNNTKTDPRAIVYEPGRVVGVESAGVTSTIRTPATPGAVTVGAVMTNPPAIIDPDAPLFEVIHRLTIGNAEELVVTVGSRPAGVITPRQLLTLLTPEDSQRRPRRALDLIPSRSPRLLPDLTLAAAARALISEGRDALPVVDSHGDLIGVLGHRHLTAQLTRDRHLP